MLRSRRRQLHARIGRALCSRSAGQAEAPPELVAEHFTRAGLAREAAHHWLRAGERAKAAHTNREAASHLSRCLEALSGSTGAPEEQEVAESLEVTALALLGDLAG